MVFFLVSVISSKSKFTTHVAYRYSHLQKTHVTDQIKASDIARWQNNLLQDRSSKTVATIRTVFQTIMEDAFMDEIIKFNPFKRVKPPKQEETREKKPFTMEEMFAIIDAMPPQMRCYFAIGFFTGMRTGEIIGLQWKDIEWEERSIKVRRSRRQGVESQRQKAVSGI
jgi:integrase